MSKCHISGVDKDVHDRARAWCRRRGRKIGMWVTHLLRMELERRDREEYSVEQEALRKARELREREDDLWDRRKAIDTPSGDLPPWQLPPFYARPKGRKR